MLVKQLLGWFNFHEKRLAILVSIMDKEPSDIDGVSFDCDWCGISFTYTPITAIMKANYYCSMDCCHAGYFLSYTIASAFGFLVALSSLLLPSPGNLGIFILGFAIGLLYLLGSFHTGRKRRRTPKGSRKEQHLDNDVG